MTALNYIESSISAIKNDSINEYQQNNKKQLVSFMLLNDSYIHYQLNFPEDHQILLMTKYLSTQSETQHNQHNQQNL